MFNFQTKTLVIPILVTMEALARGKEIISNVLVEKGIQENSAKVSIEFIHEPQKRNNSFKHQIFFSAVTNAGNVDSDWSRKEPSIIEIHALSKRPMCMVFKGLIEF